MQGRRTFVRIDAWLQQHVRSEWLRLLIMVVGLLLLHVVLIALVSVLVQGIVALLQ